MRENLEDMKVICVLEKKTIIFLQQMIINYSSSPRIKKSQNRIRCIQYKNQLCVFVCSPHVCLQRQSTFFFSIHYGLLQAHISHSNINADTKRTTLQLIHLFTQLMNTTYMSCTYTKQKNYVPFPVCRGFAPLK